MADLLVTGANGQLGFEIARLAAGHGLTCSAMTRDDLDITDPEAVKNAVARVRPKVIVNAAAYTAVDKAETDKDLAFRVNRDGPGFLAEAAEASGAALVHISTDYVFDGTKQGAYSEMDPVAPLGVYGESKEAGERAVREAVDRHIILRTAWVFDSHGANFVKTMLRVGAARDELRVVDDQTGCPTYAADLADTILTLSKSYCAGTMPENGYGTFHCAGTGAVTWCVLRARYSNWQPIALARFRRSQQFRHPNTRHRRNVRSIQFWIAPSLPKSMD